MAHFMGKEGFVWWQGCVEDRHDPLYLGRCKVRILGWHTDDKAEMPTHSLPWAYPMQPITSAAQTGVGITPLGPVEGTWVFGFYRDGEAGQEPVFMGTLGGIPELSAEKINTSPDGSGGKGFFDPRLPGGDPPGHPMFPDEGGFRMLDYNPAKDIVPREPASIIHDSNPNPAEEENTTTIGDEEVTHAAVKSLIADTTRTGYSVKLVENPNRSTFPDIGLGNNVFSVTRKLDYMKEPTTNRLARGIRGNDRFQDPRQYGIVREKNDNARLQADIATPSGFAWSEPPSPWQAIYPYNHVQQTESGHIIEKDDTPGAERLHWYHRTGSFTEIHPGGIKVDKIVNNYYKITLGADHEHVESSKYSIIDGAYELGSGGNMFFKSGGSYLASAAGSYTMKAPKGTILAEGGNITLSTSGTLFLKANKIDYDVKTGAGTEKMTGDLTKVVGGKFTQKVGAMSITSQGTTGIATGGGLALNITDSINASIFGGLPAITLGYSNKVTTTLGKQALECTDSLLTGGIELNLGPGGVQAGIQMPALATGGGIKIYDNLGAKGISASSLLGPIKLSSLLAGIKLELSGAAKMEGLLGEVAIGVSGKVKIKGLVATLGEILKELIDIITNHTHPSGTGPTGPPMPPASVQLALLKSLKVGLTLD